MPLTGQAKTDYMRDYMRRRRSNVSPSLVVPQTRSNPPLETPADDTGYRPLIEPRSAPQRRLHEYMVELNRRGKSLILTANGYEMVTLHELQRHLVSKSVPESSTL